MDRRLLIAYVTTFLLVAAIGFVAGSDRDMADPAVEPDAASFIIEGEHFEDSQSAVLGVGGWFLVFFIVPAVVAVVALRCMWAYRSPR